MSAREAIQYSVNIVHNVSIKHSQCPFPCVADTVIGFVPPLLSPTQRRKWKRDSISTRRKGSAFLITFPGGGGGGYLTNFFYLEIGDILFIL